jgi:hypothetical protein
VTSARTTLIVKQMAPVSYFPLNHFFSRISCKQESLSSHSLSVHQRNRSIQPNSTRCVPLVCMPPTPIEHFTQKSLYYFRPMLSMKMARILPFYRNPSRSPESTTFFLKCAFTRSQSALSSAYHSSLHKASQLGSKGTICSDSSDSPFLTFVKIWLGD